MTPRCRECEDRTEEQSRAKNSSVHRCKHAPFTTMGNPIGWGDKLPATSPRWCPRRAKNKKEDNHA